MTLQAGVYAHVVYCIMMIQIYKATVIGFITQLATHVCGEDDGNCQQ